MSEVDYLEDLKTKYHYAVCVTPTTRVPPDGTYEYGHGMRNYRFLFLTPDELPDSRFLVAQEVLTEMEKNLLLPHCACEYHQYYRWDPRRYWTCPCCVGCIDSEYPSQAVIDNSRKSSQNPPDWIGWWFPIQNPSSLPEPGDDNYSPVHRRRFIFP
jgi:hypothetical protein